MPFKNKAYYFLIGFFCFTTHLVSAQDQRVADSLTKIYQEDKLEGLAKLELLRNLAVNEGNDLELTLKYAEELIALATLDDNDEYLYHGYLQKGNSLRLVGDLNNALDAYIKSGEVAKKNKFIEYEAVTYTTIAGAYSEIGNAKYSESYYNKGIQLLRKTGDSLSLAGALLNAGENYIRNKKYDLALQYLEESGPIFKNFNHDIGTAYNLGNIGMVYVIQGKHELAMANFNIAIPILEEIEDYYAISAYLPYISDIYLKQNDWNNALLTAQRSLDLAQKIGLIKQIGDANLQLSEVYEQKGDLEQSEKYKRDHGLYRDSLTNIETVRQMADLQLNYEVSQKQLEVDLLEKDSEILQLKEKRQKTIIYVTIFAFVLIFLLALTLYRRYHYINKTNKIIDGEKKRSQNLLLNILPKETAQELIQSGKVQAKKFESITVLFTDFEGFTRYAENLSPEKLVESVDYYFSKFDEIMAKYQLEKIKTVGDSYMCAGGLHYHKEDHATKMVEAAFEIDKFVKEAKKGSSKNETRFDMRIGINTGPVVAGVVGTRKFAYDIWGDTVNIASRMENNSEPGKINVSENTYELIKGTFGCEYRGEIEVKNRGKMKMYFVSNTSHNIVNNC